MRVDEAGVDEAGVDEVRVAEGHADKVRFAEGREAKGRAVEVRSAKVHRMKLWAQMRIPRPVFIPRLHALLQYRELLFVGHCFARPLYNARRDTCSGAYPMRNRFAAASVPRDGYAQGCAS